MQSCTGTKQYLNIMPTFYNPFVSMYFVWDSWYCSNKKSLILDDFLNKKVKTGTEVTCVLEYCTTWFVSILALEYYSYLVSSDCLLQQEALFFYPSSPIATDCLKYLETPGLMRLFFFGFVKTQKL